MCENLPAFQNFKRLRGWQATCTCAFAGASMSKHEEDNAGLPNDVARGINGIFRGLTSLVNAAAKLTESTDAVEIARNGSFGVHDGVQAAYGVSVRIGPQRPVARPVRSVRRQTESAPPAEEHWE